MSQSNERRCPVCGEGVLQHLGSEDSEQLQQPESAIIETYSCGHEVTSAPLASADADRLEVERRSSEDSADAVVEGAAGVDAPVEDASEDAAG
jgi:hypothetical protein